jgi:hypothetical protein
VHENFIQHRWPIAGGTMRLTIERREPLPADVYPEIGVLVAAGDVLAALLPADDEEKHEPLADWERELLEPRP